MRVLSWNINGIRASKRNMKEMLDSLNSDVICLQETKVTRDMLDEPTAIVEGYSSYFSHSKKRSGYSGTANYCKNHVTPECAEEGLSGILTLTDDDSIGNYGNHTSFSDDEIKDLDAEGRAVLTQHKIRLEDDSIKNLVIINVYCPRFDPDRQDRHMYKLRFYALLQTRAEALLKAGCHVIILGDINTTHKDIDHCDPEDEESLKKPSRRWLNQMLWEKDRDPSIDDDINRDEFNAATPYTVGGKFVDTYRYFHPDKEGAFTNWCTLTNARATNYGRRLDYILADVELADKCLKDVDILQDVEGSDHCPITVDLKCTCIPASTCPSLCTKFMPEFSGKQQKLSNFFTKVSRNEVSNKEDNVLCVNGNTEADKVKLEGVKTDSRGLKRTEDVSKSSQPVKRQKTGLSKSTSGAKQSSLMAFFNKGSEQKLKKCTLKVEDNSSAEKFESAEMNSKYFKNKDEPTSNESQGSNSDSIVTTSQKLVKENSNETTSVWKNLLGGLGPAPLCKGHNEPCVLRMVKKPGPNKGKQFYTCARGEGHKSNPEARCDFFKWVTMKKK
ncbi:DNA-(apurinic or apyrimidinic site) lyase 2 [Mactra antiquata]